MIDLTLEDDTEIQNNQPNNPQNPNLRPLTPVHEDVLEPNYHVHRPRLRTDLTIRNIQDLSTENLIDMMNTVDFIRHRDLMQRFNLHQELNFGLRYSPIIDACNADQPLSIVSTYIFLLNLLNLFFKYLYENINLYAGVVRKCIHFRNTFNMSV